MSTGHPHREPDWLYDKAQRQIKRREDLARFERLYRREAGLPEGPLDLLDHVSLELALKTHELFMDQVFWGEGTGELTGIRGDQVHKLSWYDPRPPVEPNPSLAAFVADTYEKAMTWFDDASFQFKYRNEYQGVPRQEVNLSRETMDLLAGALDRTLEHYGTSEHTDPRGFWMRLDVESDQGPTGET